MVLRKRPGYFLGTGAAFCSYGLVLMGGFRAGFSLDGSGVEGEKGLEVTVGDSPVEDMRVGDLVAEDSVSLREQRVDLFGSGASFYSSNLILVE